MVFKSDTLLLAAIAVAAEDYSTSVLPELLTILPPELVLKVVVMFSGEWIYIPSVGRIWSAHRRRIIRERLDAGDDREKLAVSFGITKDRVAEIYTESRRRQSRQLNSQSIEKKAARIVRHSLEKLRKDTQAALYWKR